MRSVKELKDALVTEQTKAIELVDQAVSSIDTLLTVSIWGFATLAVIIGILAVIVGYVTLTIGVIAAVGFREIRYSAEKTANDAAKKYMESDDFETKLDSKIGKKGVGEITESLKKSGPDEQGNSEQIFKKKDG